MQSFWIRHFLSQVVEKNSFEITSNDAQAERNSNCTWLLYTNMPLSAVLVPALLFCSLGTWNTLPILQRFEMTSASRKPPDIGLKVYFNHH